MPLSKESRHHKRTVLNTDISVNLSAVSLETLTVNISSHGVGVKTPPELLFKVGQTVSIAIGTDKQTVLRAKIAHVEADSIGLALISTPFSPEQIKDIVSTAPLRQRFRVGLRRILLRTLRRGSVVALNTLFCTAVVRFFKPSLLFVVYGDAKAEKAYLSPAMKKWLPDILIGGFIRNGRHRGLMVGSKYLESELQNEPDKMRKLYKDLPTAFPGIKKIALVGRMPNFVMKAGLPIEPPFVDGSMGTRYMITDASRKIKNMRRYQSLDSIVVLGGAGRIGDKVCLDLSELFPTVIAFDSRYLIDEHIQTPTGDIIRTSNPQQLTEHLLFIALTHHGDAIEPLIPYIPSGSLVADDTHPSIGFRLRNVLQERGVNIQKIVLSHPEFSLWPRLPEWSRRSIPGCLVEGLVLLEDDDVALDTLEPFALKAAQLGFSGELERAMDE